MAIIILEIMTDFVTIPLFYDVDGQVIEEKVIRFTSRIKGAEHFIVSRVEEFNTEIMGHENVYRRYKQMINELIDTSFIKLSKKKTKK